MQTKPKRIFALTPTPKMSSSLFRNRAHQFWVTGLCSLFNFHESALVSANPQITQCRETGPTAPFLEVSQSQNDLVAAFLVLDSEVSLLGPIVSSWGRVWRDSTMKTTYC